MKKNKLYGMITLIIGVMLSLTFTACPPSDDDTPEISSFAGTWNASSGRSIVFTGNSFNYKVNSVTQYSGTFSVSGSTITFNESSLGTASGNFTLSADTIVFSNHTWDSSVNGTYTKDTGDTTGNYAYAKSGTTYTITTGTSHQTIQDVVNAIRTDASGTACTIQFGNGTDVLDIGEARVQFEGGTWGDITLTGKITSSNSQALRVESGISVTSTADIANTNSSTESVVVYVGGTLTINGGTVQNTGSGYAISNEADNSTGTKGTVTIGAGATIIGGTYGVE